MIDLLIRDETRVCAQCGCTDECACPGGCWWAGERDSQPICSSCALGLHAYAGPDGFTWVQVGRVNRIAEGRLPREVVTPLLTTCELGSLVLDAALPPGTYQLAAWRPHGDARTGQLAIIGRFNVLPADELAASAH